MFNFGIYSDLENLAVNYPAKQFLCERLSELEQDIQNAEILAFSSDNQSQQLPQQSTGPIKIKKIQPNNRKHQIM